MEPEWLSEYRNKDIGHDDASVGEKLLILKLIDKYQSALSVLSKREQERPFDLDRNESIRYGLDSVKICTEALNYDPAQ